MVAAGVGVVAATIGFVSLSAASSGTVPRGHEIAAQTASPTSEALSQGPIRASVAVPHQSGGPAAASAPAPQPTYIATLTVSTPYYADYPSVSEPPAGNLPATNPFGGPEVLAVVGDVGPAGWLHVELPIRPNGSTGWIPSAGVQLTETYYRVIVSLAQRTLTVTNYGKLVLKVPAAVGAPSTPTPPDSTYLWELIRPDDPNGAYGPYIFGLAEYSDAYAIFNGGDAQIGIHGQDDPGSVGLAVSHGCIRLDNQVITEIAGFLPLGTPVTIS